MLALGIGTVLVLQRMDSCILGEKEIMGGLVSKTCRQFKNNNNNNNNKNKKMMTPNNTQVDQGHICNC